MNNQKSMLETAYAVIEATGHELAFTALYDAVAEALSMNQADKDARIGDFYAELTLDGRFVTLQDNTWDLRSRHVYDKVHIDVNAVYSDVEESESDEDAVDSEESDDVGDKPLSEDEEGGEAPSGVMSDDDLTELGVLK